MCERGSVRAKNAIYDSTTVYGGNIANERFEVCRKIDEKRRWIFFGKKELALTSYWHVLGSRYELKMTTKRLSRAQGALTIPSASSISRFQLHRCYHMLLAQSVSYYIILRGIDLALSYLFERSYFSMRDC